MKMIIVVMLLFGAASAQESTCTLDQTRGFISDDCLAELTRALATDPTISDPAAFLAPICTSDCYGDILDYLENCFDLTFFNTDITNLRQSCSVNANGDRCINLINSFVAPSVNIATNCLTDALAIPDTCRDTCPAALQSSVDALGCCMSLLNNTFTFREDSSVIPLVSYQLWSSCGVETPAICGASAIMAPFLLASLMVVLAALLV